MKNIMFMEKNFCDNDADHVNKTVTELSTFLEMLEKDLTAMKSELADKQEEIQREIARQKKLKSEITETVGLISFKKQYHLNIHTEVHRTLIGEFDELRLSVQEIETRQKFLRESLAIHDQKHDAKAMKIQERISSCTNYLRDASKLRAECQSRVIVAEEARKQIAELLQRLSTRYEKEHRVLSEDLLTKEATIRSLRENAKRIEAAVTSRQQKERKKKDESSALPKSSTLHFHTPGQRELPNVHCRHGTEATPVSGVKRSSQRADIRRGDYTFHRGSEVSRIVE